MRMTNLFRFCAAILFSCVARADDIRVENLPLDQIQTCLPKDWRIEPVIPADTVSGWKKLGGSKGICLTISRAPYDNTLHRTKSGDLAVSIPRFYLYVFPADFQGEHVNTSAVFRDGKVAKAESTSFGEHAVLVMENFTSVGDWFVFHNNPSFPDWKNPVDDVIKQMKKIPNTH